MLEKLMEVVKFTQETERVNLYLKRETFNDCLKSAESIQMDDKGYLLLRFETKDGPIMIRLYINYHENVPFFVEVEGIYSYNKYTHIKKSTMYESPHLPPTTAYASV
ncbi:MAG: hypothetical protein J5507_03660 [Clostridia bacterium]|nr:hypothetical protein [Clostridia bacterium]